MKPQSEHAQKQSETNRGLRKLNKNGKDKLKAMMRRNTFMEKCIK